jgi:hypothetical protein
MVNGEVGFGISYVNLIKEAILRSFSAGIPPFAEND